MTRAAGCWCSLAVTLAFAVLIGCNKASDTPQQAQAPASNVVADADPASGNLAPVDQSTAATQPPSGDTSAPAAAPEVAANYPPDAGNSSYDLPVSDQSYPADSGYDTSSDAQPIEAADPPPPLPEYTQPEWPGDGYYWTPGYWAYGSGGYYWVPGAWVMAPWVDALWTPPYWDYEGSSYRWHAGYWGPHIGFYGGVDYGFGYTGRGYYGAYWNHGTLNYNRSVTNINTTVVQNVYNYSVPRGGNSRVSYNGGRGGINARPTPQEMAVVHDPRTPPVAAQSQHAREASTNRAQFVSAGHAQPTALVAARPLATNYRAPAVQPPAAAMRNATAVQTRPNQPATRENRPGDRPVPEQRPAPEVRSAPQPAQRPAPEVRPAPQPAQRPAQEARPAPQPVQRPAPEVRPVPQPAQRPAPEARPAPQPVQRPAPEARPAPQAVQRPAQEARPVPQPAQRPAPEARPAPQPVQRPAPEARPAPQPAQRPAPPAAAPRPAPQARPAPPPQAKPKPEEKKE